MGAIIKMSMTVITEYLCIDYHEFSHYLSMHPAKSATAKSFGMPIVLVVLEMRVIVMIRHTMSLILVLVIKNGAQIVVVKVNTLKLVSMGAMVEHVTFVVKSILTTVAVTTECVPVNAMVMNSLKPVNMGVVEMEFAELVLLLTTGLH